MKPRFAHSRLYDLAAAAPLILVYGFACAGNIILMARQWPAARDLAATLTIANEAALLLFFGQQIVLCFFRRLPIAKSDGFWPRAIALLGANASFALLLLPRTALGETATIIAGMLTIGGTAASTAVLFWLGRAFSILPEARHLVIGGPYRVIRHPLYLTEMIATLGIMLQFRQPWAALIVLATFVFQLRRMHVEEDVLASTFPSYRGYSRKTARLIPGLY